MNYSLSERKLKIGKQAGKTVRIARARIRGRISFARFCDLVAEHTTFNYMEVASILNLSADMARGLVAGGETVEYGRLGCLCPSLRSKAVAKEIDFNATTHTSSAHESCCAPIDPSSSSMMLPSSVSSLDLRVRRRARRKTAQLSPPTMVVRVAVT